VPTPYDGPSSAELAAAIQAESQNLTSVRRLRELRKQHAIAQRHELARKLY
jgi:hypothetical protein